MTRLQEAFRRIADELDRLSIRWAVVGGLAVSARAEPRATRDVDLAIAVTNDQEAEQVVAKLVARGYVLETVLEHKMTGRMATVRLRVPGAGSHGVLIDLFFASSGAEPEIVASANPIELWPGTTAPVATIAHLLALKILASRPKDLQDFEWLVNTAEPQDIQEAREILAVIKERGFDREKNLLSLFEEALRQDSVSDFFSKRKK